MMHWKTTRTAIGAILFCMAIVSAADKAAHTERPSGDYRVVRLELSKGLRFEDDDVESPQIVHLAFRDDRLANWWIIDHRWHAMHQHAESVRLTDKGVHGDLSLRIYDGRGTLQNTAALSFHVARKDDSFDGVVDIEVANGKMESWEATAHGSLLKATGTFDSAASWSSFAGPKGTLEASKDGPALVDDLEESQPLWRSESHVPVSYGNAADDRYATRAAGCRSGGGSSSPVYADGVIYIGFYVPNRSVETDWSRIHENRRAMYSGEGFKKLIAEKGYNDVEVRAIQDHFLPLADEVMVAIDARTGATLWRTTWPLRAYNLQTHKHRGTFGVPLVAAGKVFYPSFNNSLEVMDAKTGKPLWKASEPGGFVWGVGKRNGFQVAPVYYQGVVYSMGTAGRLFAYSAKDGKKLWQTEPEAKMVEEREKHLAKSQLLQVSARYGWQQSLVLAGGTLIVPRHGTLLGLEPTTGKKRWELPKIISRWATPTVWKHDGDEYLLCATGGKPGQGQLRLIDPAAGKVLWTVDGLHATQFNLAPSRDYVLVNVGSSIMKEGANGSAPKNADGDAPFGLLGAYKITPKGAQRAWTLPDKPHFLIPTWNDSVARPRAVIRNGLVYHTTEGQDKENDRRFIVAREDTGEVLVDEPRINDFWFQLIEDKLLYCRDWSHGKSASWYLYSADPNNFKHLSGPWSTAQPLTTSYQVLMEPPVIAGHIFLRTETGTVVCYDLTEK